MYIQTGGLAEVAAEMAVSVETVERWIQEVSWAAVVRSMNLPPDAEFKALDRTRDAEQLLAEGNFVEVNLPSGLEWTEEAGDLWVEFSDLIGHRFSDLVDETVGWLLTLPGIRDAQREDRELICLWGETDRGLVAARTVAWWTAQLELIVG